MLTDNHGREVAAPKEELFCDSRVAAIRSGNPTSPPRFVAGDYVFSSFHGGNVRVIETVWDMTHHEWRVALPGWLGSQWSVSRNNPSMSTIEYVETSPRMYSRIS